MRTAIFTIDTEVMKQRKKSAAGEALKRMLGQNRLEVKAAKFCQEIRSCGDSFRQLADSALSN